MSENPSVWLKNNPCDTGSDLDLSVLPLPRQFKGHPDVPWAIGPEDLAAMRPNCENLKAVPEPYSVRVKAQKVLREADEAVANAARRYMIGEASGCPYEDLWSDLKSAVADREKAKARTIEVGTP